MSSFFNSQQKFPRKEQHLIRISTTGSESDSLYFVVDVNNEYSLSRAFNSFHSQSTVHVIVFKEGVTLKFWKAALDSKADFSILNNMILAERIFKTSEATEKVKAFV